MLLLSVLALALPARAQTPELTVSTFESVADANIFFVGFVVPNGTNFAQFTQVHLGTGSPASFSHAFYRFDLSTIFVGSTIVSANLTLFQTSFLNFGGQDTMNVTAFATAVGWTEEQLNFDRWNQDDRDYTGLSGSTEELGNATTSTFVTWNATVPVDAWVQGVRTNHGFRLGAIDAGQAFLSSREAIILANRPILTVTYLRTVPSDPGAHPLAPFIAALGVPVELFLAGLGIVTFFLAYLALFAAHYPEDFGGRKPARIRDRFRRF